MKEKIFNFVKEKKELLIFIGVVLATFATVMIIANVASNVNKNVKTTSTDAPINITKTTTAKTTTTTKEIVIEKMIRPLAENDFDISRQFYDNDSILAVDAVIEHNGKYFESYGISYTTLENKPFDVLATFSGEVTNITYDEDYNNIITVMHEKGVSTTYSSVIEVSVVVGDHVNKGDKLGVASTSDYDKEAKLHVHLELYVENQRINPTLAIGKTIDEILALVS